MASRRVIEANPPLVVDYFSHRRNNSISQSKKKLIVDQENYEAYQPVAFLVPKDVLLKIRSIHETSESLYPIYSWDRSSIPKYCFVSHRWLYEFAPDNQLNTILLIIQIYAKIIPSAEYFWIDFACIAPENRQSLVEHIPQILENAQAFLVLPFRMDLSTMVPSFDLDSFCLRAWCIMEFAFMALDLAKVKIAFLKKSEASLSVQFVNPSTECIEDGMGNAVHTFVLLKNILRTNDFTSFCRFFKVTEQSDYDLIWAILLIHSQKITSTFIKVSDVVCEDETKSDHKWRRPSLLYEADSEIEHHIYNISLEQGLESSTNQIGKRKDPTDLERCSCEMEECKACLLM